MSPCRVSTDRRFERDAVAVARRGNLTVPEVVVGFGTSQEFGAVLGAPSRFDAGDQGPGRPAASTRRWCSCAPTLASPTENDYVAAARPVRRYLLGGRGGEGGGLGGAVGASGSAAGGLGGGGAAGGWDGAAGDIRGVPLSLRVSVGERSPDLSPRLGRC